MTENESMNEEAELLALIVQGEMAGPFSVGEITAFYTKLISEGHGELVMPFLRTIEAVVIDARRYTSSVLYESTHGNKENNE